MPSSSYRITEPHPSVPTSHYTHSGRGGAGNVAHVDPKAVTSSIETNGPASRTNPASSSSSSASPRAYGAGRGGAGNIHGHASERPIFSFDEELERQQRMLEHQAPVYHIGRGGAGNYASSRRSSSGSETSGGGTTGAGVRTSLEGTWHRLRDSLAK